MKRKSKKSKISPFSVVRLFLDNQFWSGAYSTGRPYLVYGTKGRTELTQVRISPQSTPISMWSGGARGEIPFREMCVFLTHHPTGTNSSWLAAIGPGRIWTSCALHSISVEEHNKGSYGITALQLRL